MEDGRGSYRVGEGGQAALVQLVERDGPGVEAVDRIDKLLKGDVAVAGLAVEVALLVGGVLHVEGVEPLELSGLVVGDVVAALGLVDSHLAARGHVVEVLVAVDAGLLRCGPRRRVDASGNLGGVVLLLPCDENSDGILGDGVTSEAGSNALGARSRHLDGLISELGDHGVVDVNVMTVQVVGYIRVYTGPRLEGLELRFWLRHVRVEVVEVAELLGLVSGVGVGRIEALVVLNENKDILLPCCLDEFLVMFERLDRGLGDQHVDAALDGIQGNWVMCRIWREDGDGIAGTQSINGGLVGIWVFGVICRERLEGGV